MHVEGDADRHVRPDQPRAPAARSRRRRPGYSSETAAPCWAIRTPSHGPVLLQQRHHLADDPVEGILRDGADRAGDGEQQRDDLEAEALARGEVPGHAWWWRCRASGVARRHGGSRTGRSRPGPWRTCWSRAPVRASPAAWSTPPVRASRHSGSAHRPMMVAEQRSATMSAQHPCGRDRCRRPLPRVTSSRTTYAWRPRCAPTSLRPWWRPTGAVPLATWTGTVGARWSTWWAPWTATPSTWQSPHRCRRRASRPAIPTCPTPTC